MIDVDVLRGYVLEELLAALLRSSGYELLVDATQDPPALTGGGNGLRVRGRGADHQVDVLGQLTAAVEFVHPIRLFVEAKCRGRKTGLAEVRNALGVLDDVNQHYSWKAARDSRYPYVRYQYRYALFSTSGFTDDAQRYAITQQITLVDLRTPGLSWLRNLADRLAKAFLALAVRKSLVPFPVGRMREALRRALGTWTAEPAASATSPYARALKTAAPYGELRPLTADFARIAAEAARDLQGVLYFAWTSSPFVLVVYADDADAVEAYLRSRMDGVRMQLRMRGPSPESSEFVLAPRGDRAEASVLRFTMPTEIEADVLGSTGDGPKTLRILLSGGFEASVLFDPINDLHVGDEGWLDRRAQLWFLDSELDSEPEPARWSQRAVELLLAVLRADGSGAQADVIEHAARAGGLIERPDVYEVAAIPSDRTLRGFTRPVRRIMRLLAVAGVVDEGVAWPLEARYEGGGEAVGLTVPAEFVDLLRP